MTSEEPLATIDTAHRLLVEELAGKDADAFDYKRLASEISRTLSLTQGPFVYAICGGWGSGKSSLLKFIMEELAKNDGAPALVYFNAWGSLVHQDLLAALVYQIDDQLRQHPEIKKQMQKSSFDREELRDCLGILLTGGVRAAAGVTPLTKFFADVFCGAADQLRETAKDPFKILQAEAKVRDGFDQLSAAVSRAETSAYVFIDELDRCPPEGAVQVIEALKMVFSGPDELSGLARELTSAGDSRVKRKQSPFKYVVAIDENYITRAFSQQYGLSQHEAFSYSAKFIQFRYHFPNKDWVTFLRPIVGGFREREYSFPDGTAECVSKVLDGFGVENPRDARHILAYLATWHGQYYARYRVLETVSENAAATETNARLIALAGYLGVYACMKVLYPEFVDIVLRRRIFPGLVDENDRQHKLNQTLSEIFGRTLNDELGQDESSSSGVGLEMHPAMQNNLRSFLFLFLAGFNAVDEYIGERLDLESSTWSKSRQVVQLCLDKIFTG